MSIDLSAFIQTEDLTDVFVADIDRAKLQVDGVRYDVAVKEPMRFTITGRGSGKVDIVYTCKASVVMPCARCLKPVDHEFIINGERNADLSDMISGGGDEDLFFIDKTELYPELLLVDEILMQWPIRVLCKEDCKGICSRCGADLNVAECDCDRKTPDLRMAAIKDIFSQIKEV